MRPVIARGTAGTSRIGAGRRGFTLIELLVVIVIIALLAALGFSSVRRTMVSAKAGRATSNLRQIGALMLSYSGENDNCLPILIDWRAIGSSPDNWNFWQNTLRRYGSQPTTGPASGQWLPEIFYDPAVKLNVQHPWGSFGGNDSIMLGLGQPAPKDCQYVFGTSRGTPILRIGTLSRKVLVATARDVDGSPWGSSWYFQGREWAAQGDGSALPKPDARHGGRALCLFADGHVEGLVLRDMGAAERRQLFQLDEN